MIPFFFFFTMCLMVGVEDDRESDCSTTWYLIYEDWLFDALYEMLKSDESKTPARDIVGFFIPDNQWIFVRNNTNWEKTLIHESEHARCHLTETEVELEFCHFRVDIESMTKPQSSEDPRQSMGYVNAVPTPKISEKMAFREQMYSNQYVTLNRLDVG